MLELLVISTLNGVLFGMLLFLMTFVLNLLSSWLRARFREEYN